MKNTMINIFSQIWPMIVICTIIIVILRIAYLIKNRQNFIFYKEVFMLFFIVYMMCLFYVVTFQDIDVVKSGYNIIPFKEMFRYKIGSRLFFKNVIGNLLMFIPFGFFTAYILREIKLRWVFIITLIISIAIEIIQTKIGRIFDIDDVILNVVGGVVGFLIYIALDAIEDHLPNFMRKHWFYNLLTILLLAVGIIFLIKIL